MSCDLIPRRRRRIAAALFLTTSALLGGSASAESRLSTCTLGWRSVPAPAIPGPLRTSAASRRSLAVVSGNDVWSVGSTGLYARKTLIERWDGHGWRRVASANGAGSENELMSAAAASSRDVWAVGRQGKNWVVGSPFSPLVERWNGRKWRISSAPFTLDRNAELAGVAVVASDDVWAVGSAGGLSGDRADLHPLLAHWDGARWAVTKQEEIDGDLEAIAAVGPNLWAVGRNGHDPLTEHWDGKSWRVVTAPPTEGSAPRCSNCFVSFNAVSGSSDKDVWAVGYDEAENSYVDHWNGVLWTRVRHVALRGQTPTIRGVVAFGDRDAWLAGGSSGVGTIERWNGTRWNRISLPAAVPQRGEGINAVAAGSPHDIWLTRDSGFLHYGCT